MQPALFDNLYRIIFGPAPTDLDPTWPAEVREELLADLEAAAAGISPGEIAEERREKN